MTLKERLDKIVGLAEKATPGPWVVVRDPEGLGLSSAWQKGKSISASDEPSGHGGCHVCDTWEGYTGTHPEYGDCEVGADAAYIASLPDLLQLAKEQQEALETQATAGPNPLDDYQALAQAWVKHSYCEDDNLFVRIMDMATDIANGHLTVLVTNGHHLLSSPTAQGEGE